MVLKIDTSTTAISLCKRLILQVLVIRNVNILQEMLTDSIFLVKNGFISKKKTLTTLIIK